MPQKTLWSRMTGWIRSGGRTPGELPLLGATTSRPGGDGREPGASAESPAGDGNLPVGGTLSRWRRSDVVLERLQEGHTRVIGLIDSIQKHQQNQDVRAVEISSSLTRMSETLGSIELAGRQQADKLAQIAEALRQSNERASRWDEALGELPHVVASQRDALATVARQMEASGRRDEQMSSSLDSFREAVTSLGDATTSSSVAVKNLQMTTLENHERVAALMQEQNKRFLMLFSVTLVLVVIAIVVGMVALWKN